MAQDDTQKDRELIEQVRQQQHTGNHEQSRRDEVAGTREGAKNVEGFRKDLPLTD